MVEITVLAGLPARLIETTTPSAIQAFEVHLENLEAEKAPINENIAQKQDLGHSFDGSFRTAMEFLVNSWKQWSPPRPASRKILRKRV